MGVFRAVARPARRRRPVAVAVACAVALAGLLAAGGSAPSVVASGHASDADAYVVGASSSASGLRLAAATPSYALEYATLNSGRTTLVLRWNPCQGAITYKINVSAVPVAQQATVIAELRAAVARLAAAMSTPTAKVTFSYAGKTSEVPRSTTVDRQSAELVIAVTTPRSTDIKIGGGVLGYGGYNYWTWTSTSASGSRSYGAAISRGWVLLDVTGYLSLRPGFGSGLARGNVVLHELAHSVGLDHVSDSRQLMFPTLRSSAPNGYGSGDLAGLAKVGRAAGCITVPKNTFTDLR